MSETNVFFNIFYRRDKTVGCANLKAICKLLVQLNKVLH